MSKKPKTKLIDKVLTRLGTLLIASPSELKTTAGDFEVGKGFYHRPHTRSDIRDPNTMDMANWTAIHQFRMDLCQRIATRISVVTGGVSVAIGILAIIIK